MATDLRSEGFDRERAKAEGEYWSQRAVDERCARYGTLAGIGVALFIVMLFAVQCPDTAPAQTDGSAAPTILLVESGFTTDIPSTRVREESTIQSTPDVQHATLVGGDRTGQRWIWWESGPQACVFTARMVDHELVDIGGGGDCGPANNRAGLSNCRFIEEGFDVWAASGGGCASFNVERCGGPFCH